MPLLFCEITSMPLLFCEITSIPLASNGKTIARCLPSLIVMDAQTARLAKGQRYPNMSALRGRIQSAAIEGAFEYKVVKADKRRYTIKCANDECHWRLHAALVDEVDGPVEIRTFEADHLCNGAGHLGNKHATKQHIADHIAGKIRDTAHYAPKEIINDLRREMGVTVSYSQAYRARELAKSKLAGSFESAYQLLQSFCDKVTAAMPGSKAICDKDGDNHFLRLFLAFSPSLNGFRHCRPLIGLDGTHLKAKYLGILLCATAVDAEGSLYPLAFAVVNAENDCNWRWFLHHLRGVLDNVLPENTTLTFLSDRQKGLVESVEALFPGAHHSYCLRHLTDNVLRRFKTSTLVEIVWKAARAVTVAGYNEHIAELEEKHPEVVCICWHLTHLLTNFRPRFSSAGPRMRATGPRLTLLASAMDI
jgi:MULE transposase-like protein/MuDR family transposase